MVKSNNMIAGTYNMIKALSPIKDQVLTASQHEEIIAKAFDTYDHRPGFVLQGFLNRVERDTGLKLDAGDVNSDVAYNFWMDASDRYDGTYAYEHGAA